MTDQAARRDDWWIPWTFVAAFLVVLGANVTLVVFSATTWTGLETDNAYREGVAYNDAIAAAREQAALGWQSSLVLTAGDSEGPAVLEVTMTDVDDAPLYGAQVSAVFVRPTHVGNDLRVTLKELEKGRYKADADLALAGLWDVEVEVRRDGHVFQATHRVMLDR